MTPHARKAALRAPGTRETLLIVGASLIGLAAAYALLRVKPNEDELKRFSVEVARLRQESGNGRAPRRAGDELDSAQEALSTAQAALQATQQSLAQETRDQVNARSSEAVESVMQELAEAAALQGVQVQHAEPHAGAIAGMAAASPSAAASAALSTSPMAGRPLRKLTLVGTYAGLSAFLGQAQRQRQSVRVLSWSMRVSESKTTPSTQSPRLTAELVLLL